jgi:ATP-dependent helicase/nuclease subunit A
VAAGLFESNLSEVLDADQRRRVVFAAATLRELRAMKDRLPIAQLIHEALRRTGYDAILLTEFLGERKLANLQKLIDQARSFDRAGVFTLSDFITQLAEFVASQPDEPLAATHPETHDVVKLMSIHQSKGLEFPVTIVPNVGWSRRAMGPSVAFTPKLGPLLSDPDVTTGYDLFMLADKDEALEEAKRLLYVATTRAADYLILASGVENNESDAEDGSQTNAPDEESLFKSPGPWAELLVEHFDLLTGECKTQLPDGYPMPQVKVTTTRPTIQSNPINSRQRHDLGKIMEQAQKMVAEGSGKQSRYLASIPRDPNAQRQYSFSRLTGKLHVRHAPMERAGDEEETHSTAWLDPRDFGTLIHAVLAELDYANDAKHCQGEKNQTSETEAAASRDCDLLALVNRHALEHLPEAEHDNLNEAVELVRGFLASPRAAEMASALKVHKEVEFLLPWPPEESKPGGRYLQGFIDCLYCDAAGGWHLIDYKTNRVAPKRIGEVALEYEMQMLLYALAAERILKQPPVEVALHFLRPGVEHHFCWDDAARHRAVKLVGQAISEEFEGGLPE